MRLMPLAAVVLCGSLVWAQDELPEQRIITTVQRVSVPVTVRTKQGDFVNGLQQKDFRLYDNEKLQTVALDVDYTPLSLVVCIQRNTRTQAFLPYIKQMGPMLETLVVGEQGEAALIAFDHRIQVIQDWTHDGLEMKKALETLNPWGSSNAAVIDAVFEGINMLKRRPPERRRVLLLISETRDNGSEGRLKDALQEAEFANVQVFTVNINRAKAALTTPAPAPTPSPFPTASRPLPGSVPQTPDMAAQLGGQYGVDFKPIITEIFNQVKAIFIPNHAEVFTRYTGGKEYGFTGLHDLEHALSDIGETLHSQYLLTYKPNDMEDAGYHTIRVEVNRPGLRIDAREGYWMAYKAQ